MKKIVIASFLLLSSVGLFFACQKETVTQVPEAAAAIETIASREDSGICSYEVTIYNAIGTELCGTLIVPGGAKCSSCHSQYTKFGIDASPIVRTMLSTVFTIKNPTTTTKHVSFTVTGAYCSSEAFTINPGQSRTFRIAQMPTPAPGCCRVVPYTCL